MSDDKEIEKLLEEDEEETALVQLPSEKIQQSLIQQKELRRSVVQNVTPMQQRMCDLMVTTNMTDQQIASALQVSAKKIREWKKLPEVQSVIKYLQLSMADSAVETRKAKLSILSDKIFSEISSRFEEPDLTTLHKNATSAERALYLKRFAKYASFESIMRIQDMLAKQMPEEKNEVDDQSDFVVKVIERAEARRKVTRTRQDELHARGLTTDQLFDVITFDKDGRAIDETFDKRVKGFQDYNKEEVEDTVTVEKISVFERVKNKEGSNG